MRNLKKFLALVLALMMVVSVMVTVNATSYDDDADIDYKEAVDVMSGLKVLQGDGQGHYYPDRTLTRAAAAELIAKMILGPDTVAVLPPADSFSDVKATDWGSSAINYCSVANIVVGDGQGHFYPTQEVNGFGFGKLVLVALGDNGDNYTGTGWELKVMTALRANGLDKGLPAGTINDEPLTREAAAQMAFNTIMSKRITSQGSWVVAPDGTITFNPGTSNDTPLYESVFGGKITRSGSDITALCETGVLTACAENDDTSATNGTITVGTKTYKGEAGLDLIGHKVKVYYTENGKGSTDGVVYAVVDDAAKVATINVDANNDLAKALKAAGLKAATASNVWVRDYDISAANGTVPGTSYTAIAIANESDMVVDYYIVLEKDLKVVTAVRTNTVSGKSVTTYTLNDGTASKNYTDDEITVDAPLAKNDVVWVSEIGDVTTLVEHADVIEAVYNGTTASATATKYNFGSASYDFAAAQELTGTLGDLNGFVATPGTALGSGNVTNTVGNTYRFVVGADGKIVSIWLVEGEDAVDNGFVYLAAFGKTAGSDEIGSTAKAGFQALLYFADGTNKVVTINTSEANAPGGSPANPFHDADPESDTVTGNTLKSQNPGVYAYEVQDDGSYLLYQPTTAITTPGAIATNVVGTATSSTNVYGNANSVTFFVDGTDPLTVKVVVGVADLKGVTLTSGYYTGTGTLVYTAGMVSNYTAPSADENLYYYNGNYTEQTTADGTVTTYEVYLDGVKTEIVYNGAHGSATAGIVKVSGTGDITNSGLTTVSAAGNVTAYYEGTLTVGTDTMQVPDGVVYDLTEGKFSSFEDADNTVFVAVTFETVNNVKTATQVYVTKVASKSTALKAEYTYTTGEPDEANYATIAVAGANITVTTHGSVSNVPASALMNLVGEDGQNLYYGSSTNVATNKTEQDMASYKVTSSAPAGNITQGEKLVVFAPDGVTVVEYNISSVSSAG